MARSFHLDDQSNIIIFYSKWTTPRPVWICIKYFTNYHFLSHLLPFILGFDDDDDGGGGDGNGRYGTGKKRERERKRMVIESVHIIK